MPHSARSKARIAETAGRHGPGDIANVAGHICLVALCGRGNHHGESVYQRGVGPGFGGHRMREVELAGVQLQPSDLRQLALKQPGQSLVGQALVVAGKQLVVHTCARSHGSTLGSCQSALQQLAHYLP